MQWEIFHSAVNTMNWLVLGYLVLQPGIKRRSLDCARRTMLQDFEKKRKNRVIALIHRKETVNILGFPMLQFFDIEDSEAVLRAIRLTPPDMPIDLILHTPAGISLAAEQISRALLRHKSKITVYVPHYALSGGTLLALVADEIVMSPDAILGAVDPVVNQFPAASILSVAERKQIIDMEDNTFILIEKARKSVQQMKQLLAAVLGRHLSADNAENLAQTLTEGRWTQDYPISTEELSALGLKVNTVVPPEIFQYMNLFPQDWRRRPSVDFIPLQYPSRSLPPL
jgi:ClpP class serine protease